MKKYFTLAVLGLAFACCATTSFAASCGGCGSDHSKTEAKDGDKTEKTEESTQS